MDFSDYKHAMTKFSQQHWNQNKALVDVRWHPNLVSHGTRRHDSSWSQHTLPNFLRYTVTSVPIMVRVQTCWPSLRSMAILYVPCLPLCMLFLQPEMLFCSLFPTRHTRLILLSCHSPEAEFRNLWWTFVALWTLLWEVLVISLHLHVNYLVSDTKLHGDR